MGSLRMLSTSTLLPTVASVPLLLSSVLGFAGGISEDESAAAVTTERIVLQTSLDGSIIDSSPFDGLPDFIGDLGINDVFLDSGFNDSRAVIEFDLSVIPEDKRIRRAQLVLVPLGKSFDPDHPSLPIEIRGFASNGILQLFDFHRGQFEGVLDGLPMEIGVAQKADVTPVVRQVFESKRKLVGFVLRSTGRGGVTFGSLAEGPPAKLIVLTVDPP